MFAMISCTSCGNPVKEGRFRCPSCRVVRDRGEALAEQAKIAAEPPPVAIPPDPEFLRKWYVEELGLSEEQAREAFSGSNRYSQAREDAKKRMIRGLLWLAGGGGISFLLYLQASIEGGFYFVFYGAMIWGAIDFLIGLASWVSPED